MPDRSDEEGDLDQVPPSSKRQEIEKVYAQYNPQKLKDVDALIAKYGEEKLADMVNEKYGVEQSSMQPEMNDGLPGPVASSSAVRQEIEALYQQHNPQKLREIDSLIAKYGDTKLLDLIRQKYRVELSQPSAKGHRQTPSESGQVDA
eukprot:COSAG02_NODE_20666_length_820_cov_1.431345_1_plen_146_part_10